MKKWQVTLVALTAAALTLHAGRLAAAAPDPLQSIRSIEVLVEAPESNLVLQSGQLFIAGKGAPVSGAGLPPVVPPGGVTPASLGIYLLASLVFSGLERAAAEEAWEQARPVAESVQDLAMRATVLEQMRALIPASGPRWTFSAGAFPQPLPAQPRPEPEARHLTRSGQAIDPLQHLVDRARLSADDATLFVQVLPVFAGPRGDAYVNVAATLFARSGRRLADWSHRVKAPLAPAMDPPEQLRWWAQGRYRQFVVQGLRVGLLPLVEELSVPGLRQERLQQWKTLQERRFDEAGRPTDPLLEYAINGARKRSSACLLEPGQTPLLAHYERTHLAHQLVVAAICGEMPSDEWKLLSAPGVAWSQPLPAVAPVAVTRSP
jgi:hypothetical protein